jgi:hypothetical protein
VPCPSAFSRLSPSLTSSSSRDNRSSGSQESKALSGRGGRKPVRLHGSTWQDRSARPATRPLCDNDGPRFSPQDLGDQYPAFCVFGAGEHLNSSQSHREDPTRSSSRSRNVDLSRRRTLCPCAVVALPAGDANGARVQTAAPHSGCHSENRDMSLSRNPFVRLALLLPPWRQAHQQRSNSTSPTSCSPWAMTSAGCSRAKFGGRLISASAPRRQKPDCRQGPS